MVTTYLATVLGWYLVIFSLAILFRKEMIKPALTEVVANRGLSLLLAVITLILGLLLVASHNIWIRGWPLVVTVLAWFILITGILRLFFPDRVAHLGKKFLKHPNYITVVGIVFLILGLFLLWRVYMHQVTLGML